MLTVGGEQLGIAHLDLAAALAAHGDGDMSADIFTEIKNALCDLAPRDAAHDALRRADGRAQNAARPCADVRIFPVAVVKTRGTPAVDLPSCVIFFAAAAQAEQNRRVGGLKGGIGDDRIGRAVGIDKVDLRNEHRHTAKADDTRIVIAVVAEHGTETVLPLVQQRRQIKGTVDDRPHGSCRIGRAVAVRQTRAV